MSNMIEMFEMKELRLTISFRCGRKIAENARWRAPDMQSPDWAEEGEVHRLRRWGPEDIQLGDAIICRNNAPLFSMAIQMIENGLLPEIAGRDIAAPLHKVMKKLGKPNMLRLAAIDALNDWKEKELRRARDGAAGLINDKYNCIRIFLDKTDTLGDATTYLDHLLARDGRVHLMTGHKSKGLEFDRVWFLDSHLCNVKQGQDANIKYVAETRAKKFLAYVESKTFASNELTAEAS
jgi:superfamily I DNA/RNA helicase